MPVVAPLAAVFLALFAVLLMYGIAQLGKVIAHIFPSSIGVGPASIHPRSWVESGIRGLLAGVQWVIGDVIRPAIGLFIRPVAAVLHWVATMERFATDLASSHWWLTNFGVPEALAAARNFAHALYSKALTYAHNLYVAAEKYAAALYHKALTYAHNLYVAAEAAATALYHKALTYAHNLYGIEQAAMTKAVALARTYAFDLVRAARSDLTKAINSVEAKVAAITTAIDARIATAVGAGVSTAEAFATTAVATGIGALVTDVEHGVEAVVEGVIIDVGALEGVIATDLPDIGDLVRAIPRAVPTDLAGEIGLSLALSRAAIKYMEKCGIPNCRNLSKIGRDLQGLFGAVEGAGFLALMAHIAADPTGAAREARDDLAPVAADLANGARHLIGV